MEKLSIKSWITKIISESTIPNISPDNVGFVSTFNIKPERGSITIHFVTKDERLLQLTTKDSLFYKWIREKSKDENDIALKFVSWFLANSKKNEDKVLSEIIDDYNNLIGNDDLPKDIDNRMIGLSTTDSDTATYQTRVKPRSRNSWGVGFVTW